MWATTLSLVFGGCCSNAITLEQLTSEFPKGGTLITFIQFLAVSLQGLPRQLTWTKYGPRLKPRQVPILPYLVQVGLFYLVSLLNNVAFAYNIPMAVHIIFRSGGLVVTMFLGWAIGKKSYTLAQVLSVLVVTAGVLLTTLSATSSKATTSDSSEQHLSTYLMGIFILFSALVFAGLLGLVQEYTYSSLKKNLTPAEKAASTNPWEESMFYLHFLALPMFGLLHKDIVTQFHAINASSSSSVVVLLPGTVHSYFQIPPPQATSLPKSLQLEEAGLRVFFPSSYPPLILNTVSQLFCAAGVNRLTTQVSSLSLTLILVVRKAVSMLISVLTRPSSQVNMPMLWTGAALVMAGTVGYSLATGTRSKAKEHAKKE